MRRKCWVAPIQTLLAVLLFVAPVAASTVIVVTVAGSGTAAFWGDGGLASTTMLDAPEGVAVDSSGDVFIADTTNNRVRMVPASSGTFFGQVMTEGDIYTVAGTGTACSTHTPAGCGYTSGGVAQLATSAKLDAPDDVAVDSSGNLYIADTTDNMVAMVARSACSSSCPFGLTSTVIGDIYDIAGTGTACSTHTPAGCGYTSGGVPQAAALAKLDKPGGVAVDPSGNLYIADTTDNMVAMVARSACSSSCPFGLASTVLGDIYDLAGTGTACSTHSPAGCGYTSGGVPQAATAADLDKPGAAAVDSSGDLYIADTTDNMVAMVASSACSSSCPFGLASTVAGDIYDIAGTGTACSTHSPAGCGYSSGGVAQAATTADLDAPGGVAVDPSGNLYIADTTDNMVAMVASSACSSSCPLGLPSTSTGDIYAVAGTGTVCSTHTPAGCGYTSGGLAQAAASANLDAPGGVAVDSAGNLYIADTTDNMVPLVANSACSSSCALELASTVLGDIYDIAGTGTAGYGGDGGGAATTALNAPAGVAVDSSGDVFIADTSNNRVRMVPASSGTFFGQAMTRGDIYTVAGNGTACSTHTPAGCGYTSGGVPELATLAELDVPAGVAVDSSGNLYIADTTDNMVAMVARSACSSSCPFGLASTVAGDIYTIAGTGTACSTHSPSGCGYTSGGVAQAATSAELDAPSGVAVDSSGNLYIADKTDNMVALVADSTCSSSCVLGLASTTLGDIYDIAGSGAAAYWGDGGLASTTTLDAPGDVAVDSSGDVFIADTTDNRVRMVPASSGTFFGQAMTEGDIYTVAGNGTACSTHTPAGCGYTSGGVPELATLAELDVPAGVAVDSSGNLYIADTTDNMVAMVARSACSSSCPFGLASTVAGDIYTIAGTGTACSTHSPSGCGYTSGGVAQAATSAELDAPSGVAVDSSGNLYIADKTDNMVALVADSTCSSSCVLGLASTTLGDIYDIAGSGAAAYWGDGGLASTTTLDAPGDVAVDSSGDVFIADTTDNRVRMVPASSGTFFGQAMTEGDIYTVAGNGTACSTHTPAGCGYTSGGVPELATLAELDVPAGVAVDSSGNLYIADTTDNMVAMVARSACSSSCPFGLASTVAGDIYTIAGTGTACSTHSPSGCGYTSGGVAQSATLAKLDAPSGVAVDSSGNLYIADKSDNMVAVVARSTCSSSCPFGLPSTTVGDIYAVAGTGTACSTHTPAGCGYTSGGVAESATLAKLDAPSGVAVDSSGNLYIADTSDNMVAMVARTACSSACPFGLASTTVGYIYAVAGTGTACSSHTPAGCGYTSGGVAQPGTSANLDAPGGVAVDSSGNLYIADTADNMVAMVARSTCSSSCPLGLASTALGDIYAVAGTGTACSTHTPAGCGYTSGGVAESAISAELDAPSGVAVDSSGNLYIADKTDNMVPLVANSTCSSSCPLELPSTTLGDIYSIAGTGTAGYDGDGGGAATTALDAPSGVAVDSSGDVFIADTTNERVRMVPASSATFFGQAMTRDVIYTVAGTGTACSTHTPAGCGYTSGGAAQPGTSASLDAPSGVAVDSSGNLYIADTTDQMVAMVARSSCSSSCPLGLASTAVGDIYDVAGTGTACATHTPAGCGYTSGGAAQPGTSASLDAPSGVAVDSSGNLYIADKTDNMVPLVANSTCSSPCPLELASTVLGDIYSIAGTGTAGYNGDGGGAATTALDAPGGVAVDASGDVFIADTTNERVRIVPASSGTFFGQAMTRGDIYTVAGNGTACSTHSPTGCGYTSGGVAQAATSANLDAPGGVAVDSSGNLYIADTTDNMVAVVAAVSCSVACPFALASTTVGDIYALVGTGTACATSTTACGDTGAPASATLSAPAGVAVTPSDSRLYIADKTDRRIRELISTPTLLQLNSTISFGGTMSGRNLVLPSVLTADVVPSTFSVSGSQWSLAITSTTFSTGSVSLPSTATTVSAPIASCDTWFSACTQVAPIAGDPSGYPFVIPAGATAPTASTFFSDETGTGPQTLSFPLLLTAPANSKPGTYTSTWTITIQSGP